MPPHSPAGFCTSHQNKDMVLNCAHFALADLNSVMPSQKLVWCFKYPTVTVSLIQVYFFPASLQDKHVTAVV